MEVFLRQPVQDNRDVFWMFVCILLNFPSGILGIAMDDFDIVILDIETRKIVRQFSGHQGQINDMVCLHLYISV